MIAPSTHVLPLTTVRRERLLPGAGRVIVRKGQKVNPVDVIATAQLNPQHLMLDVARGLGVSPDRADAYIRRKAGEEVSGGDVIAGPVGLMKRVVRAPQAGKVILAGSGKVFFELEAAPFELRAGLSGTVTSLVPDRGAVIETYGALIQGVWGNGGIDFGLMHVLINKPEDVLTADRLDVSLRSSVVLAGYCGDAEVFHTAASLPLKGLILSSMASSLLPVAQKMQYPIILLEGFGLLQMNAAAFNLLTTNNQREVALNAEPWEPYANTRPEIVIPLPVTGEPAEPKEGIHFSRDQRVRIVRAPHQSNIGTIVTLRSELDVFPSGVKAPAAEVRLENGTNVVLPLANLEVLE